ncbi:MAG: hypothetical protein AAFZ65_08580 [Planctomycetota bacterium]
MRLLHRPTLGASRRGASAIELMIGLTVAAVAFTGVTLATTRARGVLDQNEHLLAMDTTQSRVGLRVTRAVLSARGANVTPDLRPVNGLPTPWSEQIGFRSMEDWVGGAIEWSPQQSLRWERDPAEIDNGLDDDGDGLIDEGLLVWLLDEGGANEQRVVLASSVAELAEGELENGLDDNGNGLVDEAGASFDLTADGLMTFRLTLERAARGGVLVQRTRATRIRLRND